jgi:hypothetical protein
MEKARAVKRGLAGQIGRLVSYNHGDGWRAGYLKEITALYATIQPIGAGRKCPDLITLPLHDIAVETGQSKKYPTIEDYIKMTETKSPTVLVAQPPAVIATPVQEPNWTLGDDTGTIAPQVAAATVPSKSTDKTPFNAAEAVRLYLTGIPMNDIIKAVQGNRAHNATGNLVRAAVRAAGVYKPR